MSYLCEWCECKFTTDDFDVFYVHVREHTKNFNDENDCATTSGDYQCLWRECFSDTYTELELTRHVLFHGYHAHLKNLGLRAQNQAKLSPCSLDSQARNLVPEFPDEFSCHWEECDMVTSCPRYYYRHVDGHTFDVLMEDIQDERFPCKWEDCYFTSKKRHKLREHCHTHTHEKSFSCPTCGGLFSNKTKFLDHLRRQNTMESESYQCSHCFKYCASERILRDHMRHHVNHVKCSFCNMTCPNRSALQHHLNFRHSDNKPFSCDMCDNSFKSTNDLRRHQQTHNPVYKYSCEEENCNYVTKTLQNLRRHYKISHEGPEGGRYECHICGSRYSRGTGLTKHLKKQHTFRWPAGHNRFRYKEHDDGMYRLQTVRFESVELSQQLSVLENEDEMDEDDETEDSLRPTEGSNHQELRNMTSQEYENQLRIKRRTNFNANEGSTTTQPTATSHSSPSTSHQNHIDMVNQLSECPRQGDSHTNRPSVTISTATTTSSNISRNTNAASQSSREQDLDYRSRENIAAHAVLDLQEAASLLATLRNSGMAS